MKLTKNKILKLRMLKELDDFFNGDNEYKIQSTVLTNSLVSNKFIKTKKIKNGKNYWN